jgi:DNA polymerase III subunit chi
MSPIRVDFYLLSQSGVQARWLLACRLLEKAYLRGHRVYVYCGNQQDAENLDKLLWTFKDNSFIPHNLEGESPAPPPPVQIGYRQEPHGFNDILLNLSLEIPSFYPRFSRVMEIVANDEATKEISRSHYREYRAKECVLQVHEI